MIRFYHIEEENDMARYIGSIKNGEIVEEYNGHLTHLFTGKVPSEKEALDMYSTSEEYIIRDERMRNYAGRVMDSLDGGDTL